MREISQVLLGRHCHKMTKGHNKKIKLLDGTSKDKNISELRMNVIFTSSLSPDLLIMSLSFVMGCGLVWCGEIS